jgi:hypothetical protein
VLVEVGFLSNPEECSLLAARDYQQRVAGALASAVLAQLAESMHLSGGGAALSARNAPAP